MIRDQIIQAVQAAIARPCGIDAAVELNRPDEQFGDFATNAALKIAKELQKSPREIAQSVVDDLTAHELIEHASVAGPGFINITLTSEALIKSAHEEPAEVLKGLKVLVEYSDPNPMKPLHAGHLYTTLAGDAIARLVEVAGAAVVRLNYGGDVGLHVAKTMWSIIHEFGGETPEKLAGIPESDRALWLGRRYVEGTAAYENDEAAKAEIIHVNKRVYQLHTASDHESEFAQLYWTCRQWSYDYFVTLYERLQVHAFDRFIPESEVTPLGVETVNRQLSKGVYQESDGAIVFKGEDHGLHTRVFINSEGLPTYEAKDVGLSLSKWREYNFDESIIITANEQQQYMQVVIASIAQFAPEPAERTRHITHGVLKMSGGVKMSSRKGNVLLAHDLLDAATTAGAEKGTAKDFSTVLAAVKYGLLKNSIGGDIAYDPEESVSMEGNSGPYLQYAHARARSILRKADKEPVDITHTQEGERSLLWQLSAYSEVIERATQELAPHMICGYLYELSQTFNRFYEKNKVIGSEREGQRLALVQLYADRLKVGLQLLGIEAPEQM